MESRIRRSYHYHNTNFVDELKNIQIAKKSIKIPEAREFHVN